MIISLKVKCPLTTDYIMGNAHSGYWYRDASCQDGRRENGEWPKLTDALLSRGYEALLTEPWNSGRERLLGAVLTGGCDGNDLDMLLQFALFGRVIYG